MVPVSDPSGPQHWGYQQWCCTQPSRCWLLVPALPAQGLFFMALAPSGAILGVCSLGSMKASRHRTLTHEHTSLSNTSVGQKSPVPSLPCTAAPQRQQARHAPPTAYDLVWWEIPQSLAPAGYGAPGQGMWH